jgi:NAD(P)H dehydrogenase (quinone)
MRVMVIFAHPLEDSFSATLHRTVVSTLRACEHLVDDCDLYAEGFDPVLGAEEHRGYYDETRNRTPVEAYVERLIATEALVLCYPVWSSGPPAILKGFFDRVLLPGVSFTLEDGKVRPALTHIRHLAAVVTYGGPRHLALWMGDPSRRILTRYLYWLAGKRATCSYLALYNTNVVTQAGRKRFIDRVDERMRRFGR